MSLLNDSVRVYLKFVYRQLMHAVAHPAEAQNKVLYKLKLSYANSKYGKKHHLTSKVKTFKEYADVFPVVEYDDLKPYIYEMLEGKSDVLIGGSAKFFSKSSGTTNDVSKFIPVPRQNLYQNHLKGAWNSLALYYNKQPNAKIFEKKSLMISGTVKPYEKYKKSILGDVSAVMASNIPFYARRLYSPELEISMLDNWEEKIRRMVPSIVKDDLAMVGGVPTWMLVIFREVLKYTRKKDLLSVWPNLQGYFHGGVGFDPYYDQFKKLIPNSNFLYHEVYNASEGFFAAQDRRHEPGMLLFPNVGVYYEFLPSSEWDKAFPESIPLHKVNIGEPYAIVVSSNNGLIRYKLGDIVEFSTTLPHRMMVVGRTSHYINVFGEELMVRNTEKALSVTCEMTNSMVKEYTVAPIFMQGNEKGGHDWLIEFNEAPKNLSQFAKLLDQELRKVNSDYDAKRSFDLALMPLKLNHVPNGTFEKWLKSKNKLGGQNKVPRLANHRKYFDEIFKFSNILESNGLF